MTFHVEIDRQPGYLHATITGSNSIESVIGYMQQLSEECLRRDCYRLLVEEKLDGPRLNTIEIFALLAVEIKKQAGVIEEMAFVDEHMGDMGKFAETVAVNRGMPMNVFESVAAAKEWLASKTQLRNGGAC